MRWGSGYRDWGSGPRQPGNCWGAVVVGSGWAGGGAGVVVSSDADEVVALCDRVYVVRRGVIVRVLMSGEFDAGRLSAAAL